MPQFHQIDNSKNVDVSLVASSYLDGLGEVARRRQLAAQQQAKVANAMKLAMDRLGIKGAQGAVDEDGAFVGSNFNPYNPTRGEKTNYGKSFSPDMPKGTNSEGKLLEYDAQKIGSLASALASIQPVGTGGIGVPWNQGQVITNQMNPVLQQQQQYHQQQQSQQSQQPQSPLGNPTLNNTIQGLLKTYQQSLGSSASSNIQAGTNFSSASSMNAKDGTLTTTTKNSEITDYHDGVTNRSLDAAALMESAFGIQDGPAAKAIAARQATIKSTDLANSTDGKTQQITAGELSGSSSMNVGANVGVGQSTSISTSTTTNLPSANTSNSSISATYIDDEQIDPQTGQKSLLSSNFNIDFDANDKLINKSQLLNKTFFGNQKTLNFDNNNKNTIVTQLQKNPGTPRRVPFINNTISTLMQTLTAGATVTINLGAAGKKQFTVSSNPADNKLLSDTLAERIAETTKSLSGGGALPLLEFDGTVINIGSKAKGSNVFLGLQLGDIGQNLQNKAGVNLLLNNLGVDTTK